MYYALKKSGHTLKKMTSRLLLRSLVQLVPGAGVEPARFPTGV